MKTVITILLFLIAHQLINCDASGEDGVVSMLIQNLVYKFNSERDGKSGKILRWSTHKKFFGTSSEQTHSIIKNVSTSEELSTVEVEIDNYEFVNNLFFIPTSEDKKTFFDVELGQDYSDDDWSDFVANGSRRVWKTSFESLIQLKMDIVVQPFTNKSLDVTKFISRVEATIPFKAEAHIRMHPRDSIHNQDSDQIQLFLKNHQFNGKFLKARERSVIYEIEGVIRTSFLRESKQIAEILTSK